MDPPRVPCRVRECGSVRTAMTAERLMRREPGSEDFRAETRPPSRAYGMIVVALTVFFAGLLLWRTSIQGFLVTAEIACGRRT